MALTLDDTVVASGHQISCEVAGDAVILNKSDGEYYGLDPVGARVWALVDGPVTVAGIRDALLAEFDVETRRCEADLLKLLEDLARHGLLEILPSSQLTDGPHATP